MDTDDPADVIHLPEHECWALLRQSQVGRLAVVTDGGPDVFPVNHVVDHGAILIRTGTGTKLAAVASQSRVAFECDGYDPTTGQAWSVVVKGRAELLHRAQELEDTLGLPLFPWHDAPKPRFLRVVPTQTTGRRFVTVPPDRWARPGGPPPSTRS